jgi:hypothetical protein
MEDDGRFWTLDDGAVAAALGLFGGASFMLTAREVTRKVRSLSAKLGNLTWVEVSSRSEMYCSWK